MTLLLTLTGIAVVDSLNPSLFFAQFFLLTTPKPVPRILSYIAGILVANFFGGVLILSGLRVLVAEWTAAQSATTLYLLQLGVGLAVFAFGLWYPLTQASSTEVKKPRSLHPLHTFVLGMAVMVNELTTALPYFIAIERIAEARLTTPENLLALAAYNLVFAVPLFGFLGAYIVLRSRFAAQIGRISAAVERWVPRILKYGALLFGGVLVINGLAYLLAGVRLL